jgi:HK97 family phage portal protein
MKLTTKLRFGLARLLTKGAGMSFISPWVRTSFLNPTFDNLVAEGYAKNGVVALCITRLAMSFPEPPLRVWSDDGPQGKALPDHPLRRLLKTPNPRMGEDQFWQYMAAYLAIGGNAYGVVTLDRRGVPVDAGSPGWGLWPYHAGQIRPIPGGPTWTTGYEFYSENGEWKRVDEDAYRVIHLQWPLPDLVQPWMAQPPLRAVAPVVNIDTSLDTYIFALLENNAIPPMILTLGEDMVMSRAEKNAFRSEWGSQYGGANRGGMAILDYGMKAERLSFNLAELAFDALRKVPEARIAGAFGIPPIVIGLNVGLEQATYSNYGQARTAFSRDTLIPLWRAASSEFEAALGSAWGTAVHCRHDLTGVASLQEDTTALWSRIDRAYRGGLITMNEGRRMIGQDDQQGGDIYQVNPKMFYLSADQLAMVVSSGATRPALPGGAPDEEETVVVEDETVAVAG